MMVWLSAHRAGRGGVAVLLLSTVKIALRVAPARTLRGFHQRCNASAASAAQPDPRRTETLRQLARSIDGAARMMSGTCLESALASCLGARLLGMPVRLRLGVDQLRPHLRAHAWVECGGTVLVGGGSSVVFDR
jgi:hypothetical protein